MTPEEKKAYAENLAKQGYSRATRVDELFDLLAPKADKLKTELRELKKELSDKIAEKHS